MSVSQRKLKAEENLGQPQQAVTSHRILIVDDETGILDSYREILDPPQKIISIQSSRLKTKPLTNPDRQDRFEIMTVQNGEEAVDLVKKALAENRPFAMGFFDVLLGGGIDGIEVVRQIHALDPEMHAVLVTAYQDRHVDAIQKIFNVEFSDRWDYLNKPFTEGEILQKARNMVSTWNIRRRNELQQAYLDGLKRQMSESEKMLTIGAVARNVGHEFGNILLQIMGRADLSRAGDPVEMRKALETILVASEHASKVLGRFKNLSNPASFDQLNKADTDVAEAITETLLLMEHDLKKRNIQIDVTLGTFPKIFANHSGLVQVFMNLMINSIHAIGDGGKIEITGKNQGENIEVIFRDNGPGIPPENLDRIFEAFFTTKGDKGTGLGLSICKEVIEIGHGGQLAVTNHKLGGAVFKILLPTHSKK